MTLRGQLVHAFAAAWNAGPGIEVPDGVADRLVRLCAEARATYPDLQLDEVELVGAIAQRCPVDGAQAYVDRCRGNELALALVASRGDGAAIAMLERTHRAAIEGVCRRFATPTHPIDDWRQTLREKLFVAPPQGRPKIADYAGQGLLDNWLRVTAVRAFLDVVKRKDRPREAPLADAAVSSMLPDPSDFVLEMVKVEYRGVVKAAISEATEQLAPSDRHLLRLHLVVGLTIDQLGVSLGIHRATAARRITRAREQLVATTRELLAQRLRVPIDEMDDVIGTVASRLDLSLTRLLASRHNESAA